jgi:hypothetical protein
LPEMVTLLMAAYSYKMLMEPASKVSVPLTVVMRMRSRVPDSAIDPAKLFIYGAMASLYITPEPAHKFELLFSKENTRDPRNVYLASPD